MPGLDYTQNYHLRVPQSGDRRTLADFERVFGDNFRILDTQIKAFSDRVTALENSGANAPGILMPTWGEFFGVSGEQNGGDENA